MPKHLSLFGRWLRNVGKSLQKGFRKKDIVRPIPVKAYGRPPSASSQTGLYHDEDYNYRTVVSSRSQKHRQKMKPHTFRKAIQSNALNYTIPSLRVTTSALHAMDDAGGFDEYIMRTPPQELRSHAGEKMRNVMHFYQSNPLVKQWGLPWKLFDTAHKRGDPFYQRHRHLLNKTLSEKMIQKRAARYSPYYLPGTQAMHPERQPFVEGSDPPANLNLWWNSDKALELALRKRLQNAKQFDEAFSNSFEENSYKKGTFGRGGGGQHGRVSPGRKRSKIYKSRQIRPY